MDVLTLGIESSCDETSVSVVKNGREILSNIIDTQIPIHEKYGGVVPEIASRNHIEAISRVTKMALDEANVTFDDITAITPTYGPGLVGALLVGLGGNTQIIHVKNYTEFEVLGKTRDDAIGEAFDKVARVVGLGYPGGPKIDKLVNEEKGNPDAIELPKTHFDNLDFSFSGIKTAVINLHHKTPNINKADLCASFEKTVTETLLDNTKKAMKQIGLKTIVLAGGVSANSFIRKEFLKLKEKDSEVELYMPDLKLCTDNAAMIASAGYYNFIDGKRDELDLNAIPNLKL